MSGTNEAVEEALNELSDEVIEQSAEEAKEQPEKPEPDTQEEDDEEKGFNANDFDEEESEEQKSGPKQEEAPAAPANLNPEQQYIFDRLGEITVMGRDSADGQLKEFKVKVAQQLPASFEFANKREELMFTQALASQELSARQLQSEFQGNQSKKQAEEYEAKENAAIRDELAELQAAKEFPQFKLKPTDKNFSDDPAAKQMQEVLDIMTERNEKYLKAANQGKPYKHIGFTEAFELWKLTNKPTTEEVREDVERKQVARKIGGNRGPVSEADTTRGVPRGMSSREVLRQVLEGENW